MGYSQPACWKLLTPGKVARIHRTLQGWRAGSSTNAEHLCLPGRSSDLVRARALLELQGTVKHALPDASSRMENVVAVTPPAWSALTQWVARYVQGDLT
mmetsp:Transcript_4311/g.8506  ORF Transcript_4311/g.8506 Transcript_4311/m.8506 type:complete len:99 (-) Transcript_4311:395-691(-)